MILCARCRTVFCPNAAKSNNWQVRQSSFGGGGGGRGGESVSCMGIEEDKGCLSCNRQIFHVVTAWQEAVWSTMAVDICQTRIRYTNVAIDGIYVVTKAIFTLLVNAYILDPSGECLPLLSE